MGVEERKIVINSSILNESPSGLGVYAKNVIQEFITIFLSIAF